MDNPGQLLIRVSLEMKKSLTKKLLLYNVTAPQWAVLKDISIHLEGTTPAMIAERTYSDRPTITGILERLKAKGLLDIRDNPNDKRSNLVFITDSGMIIKNQIEVLSDEIMDNALKNISEQEMSTFMNVLKTIYLNIS
ncbi:MULTISPECIES: MarR family winged helix-turn-helix transcriptional regulator [Paenibacillus]|uniref:MarR family winged helix-turn-helix transcriptional regulator n=1 Tax=Paenibacillus TaxID=44249 RepID=UPI00096DE9A2|nr:MarR family transcriptional regulator [Paenibacillus odorifer]OME10504.1 hypothetical protein BSK60_24920 [Paenibacillus odorifer]